MLLKPANIKSPQAVAIIQQMRLSRHVIRGDRAAYEEATAKLRATFEAIAMFVLQAVLSAVLTPAAMALFRVAQGTAQAALMANRIRKFVATVTAGTAANIGSKVAVTGDYSVAQLKDALLSNIAGPLGAGGANKLLASEMLGPVAKGLVARLGPKASAELREFAKNIASMEASAAATGQSLTENLTIQGMLKEHFMSRGGELIGAATTKAAGLDAPAPVPDAGTPATGGETIPSEGAAPPPATDPTPTAKLPGTTEPLSGAGPLPSPGGASPTGGEPTTGATPRGPDTGAILTHGGPGLGSAVSSRPPSGEAPRSGAKEGTSWQPANKDNDVEALKLYRSQLDADPSREVALIYNHDVKEWAVVQGGPDKVSLGQVLARLGWNPRSTTAARHSHTSGALKGALAELTHLPSGRGFDLDVVRGDSYKGPETEANQWHTIDIMVDGKPDKTWVVYSRKTGEWTVDYPDKSERGGRGQKTFSTTEDYNVWFKARFDTDPRYQTRGGAPETLPADELTLESDIERLARLKEQVDALAEGRGLTESPTGKWQAGQSRKQLAEAQEVLGSESGDAKGREASVVTIIEQSVAATRALHTARGEPLSGERLAGFCGDHRDVTADSILSLVGDSAVPIVVERVQPVPAKV